MLNNLATSAAVAAVGKLFDHFNKDTAGTISVGLAVGYYYNFLDPISGVIERDELEIYTSPQDPSPQRFESKNVRVAIIIPLRLDVHAFQHCVDEFNSTQKGSVYLRQQKRHYGINYEVSGGANSGQITIVDLARPIMSVKRYYEQILQMQTHDASNDKWVKAQPVEIEAFKEAIRRLQVGGYGGLVNKLDFRERG